MSDVGKFRLSALLTTLLCIMIFAYNISAEYFMPQIEGYLKRRIYYEKVISKKGMSLHRALYWKGTDRDATKEVSP